MIQEFAWSRIMYGAQGEEVTVGITVPGEIHLRIKNAPFVPSGDSGEQLLDATAEASLSPVQVAELSEWLASAISGRRRILRDSPGPELLLGDSAKPVAPISRTSYTVYIGTVIRTRG